MRVTSAAFGVGGGEDGINENESADDLCGEAGAARVTGGELVGTAAVVDVESLLESFNKTNTTNSSQTLSHHVQQRAYQ